MRVFLRVACTACEQDGASRNLDRTDCAESAFHGCSVMLRRCTRHSIRIGMYRIGKTRPRKIDVVICSVACDSRIETHEPQRG